MGIIKNKKKFRRLIIGLYLLAFLILFAVLVRGITKTSAAWYNSSWLYRRPVTITGDGNTHTDLNVLVNVDTSALISSSKLQSDCDDIRFTDTDETTLIDYWIEGGCGTTSTQIWVKVPSMPTGNKTIYMYYGNTSATNSELSWSGNYMALSTQTSCPTGWSMVTGFHDRMLGGASSYSIGGSTTHSHTYSSIPSHTHGVGTLVTSTDGAHTHTVMWSQYDYGIGTYPHGASIAGDWSTAAIASAGSHTHTITGSTGTTGSTSATTDAVSSAPPYVKLLFCQPDNTDVDSIPQNLIFLFDSLPSGNYSRYTNLDGRFPIITESAFGATGGTSTHRHSYSTVISHSHGVGTLSTISNGAHIHNLRYRSAPSGHSPYFEGQTTGGDWVSGGLSTSGAHTHTISGSTASTGVSIAYTEYASNIPPYRDMIFSSLTTNFSSFEPGMIIPFSTSGPPLGWTQYSELNGKFPRGASTAGGTGGTSTHSHQYNDVPAHTHTSGTLACASAGSHTHSLRRDGAIGGLLPYISMDSYSYAWGSSTMASAGAHSHTLTGSTASAGTSSPTTSSDNHLYFYVAFPFYKRNSSLSTSVGAEEMDNQTPTEPTSLLCEGQTNPVSILDTTPEFSAIFNDPDSGDNGVKYQIEVNSESDFTGTVKWDSGAQTMTSTPDGLRSPNIEYGNTGISASLLANGQTYYWRIKFWDEADAESPWSSTASFTMNAPPNQATSLETEGMTNPTNVLDLTPEFSAIFSDPDTADTGNYYDLDVNTAPDFSGTAMWNPTLTSISPIPNGSRSSLISYNGTELSRDGSTYYWRIRFKDQVGGLNADWSDTAFFQMAAPPSAPTGLLVDNMTNPLAITSLTPTFSAIYNDINEHDATAFEIEVNSNNTFTGTVMWDTGKVSTTVTEGTRSPDYTYAGIALSDSSNTYYWRIRFWDVDDQTGDWSSTATFVDSINHQLFEGVQMEGIQIN